MKKCLIIDDVEVSRYAAALFLEDMGFSVSEAGDEEAALSMMEQDKFNVILLDWHLRKRDSLELLASLVKNHRGTPVIMISGVEDGSKAEEARKLGAVGFIQKPTTKEKLHTELTKLGLS